MRYEIKEDKNKLAVWDNKEKVWITFPLPSMEIARSICDSFNEMNRKDYRSIGLPDFSDKGGEK